MELAYDGWNDLRPEIEGVAPQIVEPLPVMGGMYVAQGHQSIRKTRVQTYTQRPSLFPPHLSRILVVPQANELDVAQMAVGRPFHELELRHQHGLKPSAEPHLLRREPWPQRPACASGRFTNGHNRISSLRNSRHSFARDAGVKPLRVRPTYTSRSPSKWPKIKPSKVLAAVV